jgi:hypothetical protein
MTSGRTAVMTTAMVRPKINAAIPMNMAVKKLVGVRMLPARSSPTGCARAVAANLIPIHVVSQRPVVRLYQARSL